MTTFGIEEEFFFLDPTTILPADVASDVFRRLSAEPEWSDFTHQEFLASQVEHASPVFTTLAEAGEVLVAFRREVDRDAARHAVSVASIGTTPDAHPFPSITDSDRYHRIVRDMAGVIADRSDRKRMMILADLGRAGLTALIQLLVALDGPTMAVILVVAAPISVLRSLFMSAYTASVPGLVGRSLIGRANSVFEAVYSVGFILGPAIAGVLAATIGPG